MNLERASERAYSVRGQESAARLFNEWIPPVRLLACGRSFGRSFGRGAAARECRGARCLEGSWVCPTSRSQDARVPGRSVI